MKTAKTFEEAIQRLDTIVNQLEQNDVPLEQAIAMFEEGLTLAKACDDQLKQFETRLEDVYQQHQQEDGHDETI